MTTPRLLIVFVAAFIAMLIALIPLSAVLGWSSLPLAAERVEGTLWGGKLTGAAIAGQPVGAVKTRLEILPLFGGVLRLRTETKGQFTGKARLISAKTRMGVDLVTGVVAVEGLGLPDATVRLDNVTAAFDRGRCIRAAGKARAQVGGGGILPQPVELTGVPVCIDGRWTLPLSGETGGTRVEVQLGFSPDGSWRNELILIPTDPALGQALAASGFTQDGDRWRRVTEGRP